MQRWCGFPEIKLCVCIAPEDRTLVLLSPILCASHKPLLPLQHFLSSISFPGMQSLPFPFLHDSLYVSCHFTFSKCAGLSFLTSHSLSSVPELSTCPSLSVSHHRWNCWRTGAPVLPTLSPLRCIERPPGPRSQPTKERKKRMKQLRLPVTKKPLIIGWWNSGKTLDHALRL